MNILSVNNLKLPSFYGAGEHHSTLTTPRFGLKMSEPLSKDTVSFGCSAKTLTNRSNGVTKKTAKIVHEEAALLQEEIQDFMNKFFKDFVVTDSKKSNIIEAIKGRTKQPDSIVEKSATHSWKSAAEIFTNMTDLNGIKIVMRDGSQKAIKRVLDRFRSGIESGILIPVELENKRPVAAKKLKRDAAGKWDYSTYEELKDFVDFSTKASGKPVRFNPFDYTPANYPAIHFLFRFPGQKRCFEIQLMGRDVSIFKDLDDVIYKILDNKNPGVEYKSLTEILKNVNVTKELKLLENEAELLKDPKNKEVIAKAKEKIAIAEKFKKYRGEAFLFQREKEPRLFDKDRKEFFLPLKYDIPHEYDLNNLYSIYQECKAKGALNAAKKAATTKKK